MKTNVALAPDPAGWGNLQFSIHPAGVPLAVQAPRNSPPRRRSVKRRDERATLKALRAAEQAAWEAMEPRAAAARAATTPAAAGFFARAFEGVLVAAVGFSAVAAVGYAVLGTTAFAGQFEQFVRFVRQALG